MKAKSLNHILLGQLNEFLEQVDAENFSVVWSWSLEIWKYCTKEVQEYKLLSPLPKQ